MFLILLQSERSICSRNPLQTKIITLYRLFLFVREFPEQIEHFRQLVVIIQVNKCLHNS